MSEWLDFEIIERKPKTVVYAVLSKESRAILGEIKWHAAWRHYCFFPTVNTQTIHSDRCLLAISQFITKLNDDHKKPDARPDRGAQGSTSPCDHDWHQFTEILRFDDSDGPARILWKCTRCPKTTYDRPSPYPVNDVCDACGHPDSDHHGGKCHGDGGDCICMLFKKNK